MTDKKEFAVDRIDAKPDYRKSLEENKKDFDRQYNKFYGEEGKK